MSAVLIGLSAISASTLSVNDGQVTVGGPAAAAEAENIARDVLHDKVASVATAKESPEARELKTKVSALVEKDFGGDYRAAFGHFAGADQTLDRNEVISLLKRAGIGNMLTRGAWADGIMERFDANANGAITWGEFSAVVPVQ